MVLAICNVFLQAVWYEPLLPLEKLFSMFCQAKSYEVLALVRESSVEIVGMLQEVPEGKTAPGGHELSVDFLRTVGAAPGGDDAFTNRLNEVFDFLIILHRFG